LCRFLRKIQQDGIIPTFSDYDVASNLFTEKKVPFLINGPWSFRDYIENHGMNIGIAPIPKVNGVWPAPYSAVKGYTISRTAVKDERKKEAVKKFVRFMTAKDAQLQMAESHQQLPAIKSAIKDKRIAGKEMMRQQQLQLEKAIAMPVITQMRAVWDAMKLVQINIFAGRTDPENAPAQMQRRAVDGMRALGMRINPATDYPEVSIDPYTEPSYSDTQ
jgi:arabinogalactan oligomer / maltooligosaccharide transport system substrate-binding protein